MDGVPIYTLPIPIAVTVVPDPITPENGSIYWPTAILVVVTPVNMVPY